MEDRIRDLLDDFNRNHKDVKCELQEDILLDIFKIAMSDLETGKRIASGIYIQDLELSILPIEDEINIVLDKMLSTLKGGL